MKIHSISTIIAIPIAIAMGVAFYVIPKHDFSLFYYLLIPLMMLAALYVSHPYIDYWWHTKYPVPLEDEIIMWLKKYNPFYNRLDSEGKKKYEYRLGLYIEAREFKMMGRELSDIPEDIKAMLASQAVELTFYKKDFLIGDFDRVYLYKHPFPSPRMQFLHTVETEIEDGVVLFSLEHVVAAITSPKEYYNVAMHGFAEAFVKVHPSLDYPDAYPGFEMDVQLITNYAYGKIQETVGYKELDPLYVFITLYFTHGEKMAQVMPDIHRKLQTLFGTISLPQ